MLMYYIHDFCLRNVLQHVRKEATKRMTFVEQAVREGGLGDEKDLGRLVVKALQVKKRAPSVPKQLRRWKKHDCMKQLRQEPTNEAFKKRHKSHKSLESLEITMTF